MAPCTGQSACGRKDPTASSTYCVHFHHNQLEDVELETAVTYCKKFVYKKHVRTQNLYKTWCHWSEEPNACVCKSRRYFRSILKMFFQTLSLLITCHKSSILVVLECAVFSQTSHGTGPSCGVGARDTFKLFRKKTSFSLVCINVLHHVDKKALRSMSVLKFGCMTTSNNFPVFTFCNQIVCLCWMRSSRRSAKTILSWNMSKIMNASWTSLPFST